MTRRPARTWWGQRFLAALEGCTDAGRLQRGRGYAGPSRILAFAIDETGVSATVRGNVNPYFGVYEEPRYETRIELTPIPPAGWDQAIAYLGERAGFVAQLLMGEMPDDIEAAFADLRLALLPSSRRDFRLTDCSCPDYGNPCKHIAGVYYRLAAELDQDPFLLFELRGLPRERLLEGLGRTPLGRALVGLIAEEDGPVEPADAFFTRPLPAPATPDYATFWSGHRRLPTDLAPASPAAVPALLIKKGGDYPPFWDRDGSFLALMEELYLRVRSGGRRPR